MKSDMTVCKSEIHTTILQFTLSTFVYTDDIYFSAFVIAAYFK
jgi:hypothetical protein